MMRVKLFFVALGDGGKAGQKIGCGDSIVAVDRQIPATNSTLTATYKALFALTDKNDGPSGLYNALYQSKLKVDGISISAGKAVINLSGSLLLGGTCDNPRVQAQIEQTALQFSTVKSVSIFLNGVALEQVLSEKGG
jgi:spore germination protein GerM